MIGRLRERVTILTAQIEQDLGGGTLKVWVPSRTIWAQAETQTSANSDIDPAQAGRRVKHFTIRAHTEVNFGMRLDYQGSHYEIRSLAEQDQRGRFLTIIAIEVQG